MRDQPLPDSAFLSRGSGRQPPAGIETFDAGFEGAVASVSRSLAEAARHERAVRIGVPPVISRQVLERSGYAEAFPHLLGLVEVFEGDDEAWEPMRKRLIAGAQWTLDHVDSDVAVLPATCYHVYPQLEDSDLAGRLVVEATGHCYRHERTHEVGRLRTFRMRELVCIDSPESTMSWRDGWLQRLVAWCEDLGLDAQIEPATDPFFGGAGEFMSRLQHSAALKWEVLLPVDDDRRVAAASTNAHRDHFSKPFQFTVNGGIAHSACTAFGLERIVLALRHRHGPTYSDWPEEIRPRGEKNDA